MKKYFQLLVHVISDCIDANAKSRYITAFWRELSGAQVHCVQIKHLLEGICCAIDIIDEFKGKQGVVFLNVAPRRDYDKGKGHSNGRPFLYFFVGKTLVISSDEPIVWEMFDKVGIPYKGVRSIDLNQKGIKNYSQFRSCHCIPIMAKRILNDTYQGELYEIKSEKIKDSILYIDNFGNVKTTLIRFSKKIKHPRIKNLTDVPDGFSAQTKGSSGYKRKRFVELVIKGGSMTEENDKVGDLI